MAALDVEREIKRVRRVLRVLVIVTALGFVFDLWEFYRLYEALFVR